MKNAALCDNIETDKTPYQHETEETNMKCPRCGSEMTLDSHRKIPLNMCYECGYIEGRAVDDVSGKTNFERLRSLNMNEMAAFLSAGLGVEEEKTAEWLNEKL